jgi:endonuclease/exonuclease/phosphatase family metal-dependent hydrolase
MSGCEPLAVEYDKARQDVPIFRRTTLSPIPSESPDGLRVVAWNIKYGARRIPFWFDCWGDRVQMSKAEMDANMAALYAAIRELDPDILMAEEIEVNSRRSAYIDMVRGILENTDLNYAAYFETWNSQYVASEGLGRVNLGNAIFSRYPITRAERIRQEDRTDLDAVTRLFYIHRAVGRAEIDLPENQPVVALVVHTEAYDNDGTKQRQLAQIHELALAETAPVVLGGDFNELPPVAIKLEDFPDERTKAVCSDDFAQPPYTPDAMQKFFDDMLPAIALERYGSTEESQARLFTHSVLGPDEENEQGLRGDWNRTLDYLFASKGSAWVDGTTDVVQRGGQEIGTSGLTVTSDYLRLSDHAPVIGTWRPR